MKVFEANPSVLPNLPPTRTRKVARWVSNIASPPVLAVFGANLTALDIATRAAWAWAWFLVGLTILIPTLFIAWMVKKGKLTDFDVYVREQRTLPYLVSLGCAVVSCTVMMIARAPSLLILLNSAALVQGTTMYLVNRRWKISAHAAGSAGFAVLIWQILGPFSSPILLVIPLVAWSRVVLRRHTLGQVIAGAALGAGIFFGVLQIW